MNKIQVEFLEALGHRPAIGDLPPSARTTALLEVIGDEQMRRYLAALAVQRGATASKAAIKYGVSRTYTWRCRREFLLKKAAAIGVGQH
jgi:hypothetical protein